MMAFYAALPIGLSRRSATLAQLATNALSFPRHEICLKSFYGEN
jgi:hypothetical protein